jgi:hypothetical protein
MSSRQQLQVWFLYQGQIKLNILKDFTAALKESNFTKERAV